MVTEMHPQLESAYERGLPESYLPIHVLKMIKGQRTYFDDLGFLKNGYRYSPKAMRTLTLALVNGIYNEGGYIPPLSDQFRYNTAEYAFFTSFINADELRALSKGKAIRGNMMQTPADLWISPDDPLIENKVLPTIESAAMRTEEAKLYDKKKKIIFFHGKWNGVPHPGHVFALRDNIAELAMEKKLLYEDMITVVACDTNAMIEASGAYPFLDTSWRISFMSYLPYATFVCAPGSFRPGDDLGAFYDYKYAILKPDFIVIESTDPLRSIKEARAKAVGAEPFINIRESISVQRSPGTFSFQATPDNVPLSSSKIRQDRVGDWGMRNPYLRLHTVKQIQEKLYGKKKWFG